MSLCQTGCLLACHMMKAVNRHRNCASAHVSNAKTVCKVRRKLLHQWVLTHMKEQWNILWRRPHHAMPHSENSCQLLRRFTPTAQYLTVSSNVSIPHARRRSRLVTARLRQCCAGGLTSLPVQPSSVSAQRCCTIHRRPTTHRPHHAHTRQFPLVEGPGAYSV